MPDKFPIKIGARVWIESIRKEATLLSIPDSKGKVEVRVGALRTHVDASDIKKAKAKKPDRIKNNIYIDAEPPGEMSLNLHGKRADESINEIDTFLNRATTAGNINLVIIHGHGSGTLKKICREFLSQSPLVESYRPGNPHEGGDGVTVVKLH